MKLLSLTLAELLAIEATTLPKGGARDYSKDFCLRLGACWLGVEPFVLEVDQDDLWAIRDNVDVRVREGPVQVGLALKRKVYQLLDELLLEFILGVKVGAVESTRKGGPDASPSAGQSADQIA